MAEIQRIRHKDATVLDQIEVRNFHWDADTLGWKVSNTDDKLDAILAKLEEIRILLGGT